MAVYTKIEKEQLENILSDFNIGSLKSYKGIAEGVENSNYIIETDQKYILTIFEKRTKKEDLPFFIKLKEYLANNGINCPKPIKNKNNEAIFDIGDQKAVIVSFLEGKNIKSIKNYHLDELGKNLAKFHLVSKDFSMSRNNDFSINSWYELFEKSKNNADSIKRNLANEIKGYLEYIKLNWPKDLPLGIIHADLFPDNVFFKNKELTAFIDFYFSCKDFLIYDIAICINSWCFEHNEFNLTKTKKFLKAYDSVRKITEEEKKHLPIICMGAAMRFLLTRLYDKINYDENSLVTPHDPIEYLNKIRFHKNIKNYSEYGL